MFTLFWLTGLSEIVKGDSVHRAMTNAGYGAGTIKALDFYAAGDKRNEWVWHKEKHTWRPKS